VFALFFAAFGQQFKIGLTDQLGRLVLIDVNCQILLDLIEQVLTGVGESG